MKLFDYISCTLNILYIKNLFLIYVSGTEIIDSFTMSIQLFV